ncbi:MULTISPECIES: acyl-CoA dehydrogenase [Nocardiopsis]|uniref:Broad-specificity linear acyl-CoA dehydrogenase FadE5 n=2 Tax=Nocardiopsis alba TaxID=53437 RepID=A0A7K2IRV0_9ACTN|nr:MULTISPECIES: acyl-CoA dehydrogenase [Nocardiopsis]AFR10588.1 acyl-CoA dehydrogenase, N-terminal domain protein [Nocardiopsis alba ATCC BAA-2165]MEC3895388.1 acyl-CoA dehydrogenase [Nocardiopsis sp. LDBS1602]MYR32643.1 acyl-CoA dehydrogenase [Nocardiopsis alba]
MTHYKSNLRDIEFNLFELFRRQDLLGQGPFEELDEETARTILDEINRLATGVVAESFEDADRNPPVFDPKTNTVAIPESLKKSYQAYMDAGWYNLDLPQELGGLGAPRSLVWSAAELILGSNPSIHMYSAGPGFASILHSEGNEAQKKFAEQAIERGWGATMVLTEPDAGSDVGAGRTKAVDQGDGTWHIEGVKRFITSAEQDMTENIFHLVLARPEGAGPGTKGLSLFLVPKYLVNEDGSLGERNGAYVTNVEHKMGLKASTTCELTFGDKHPAIGYLVGDKHDGIRQMFLIIEYARMMVGTKAIATLSTGYLNALEYAKNRVQGNDLAGSKNSPKVTITHHPDVRRSLMTQKAYVEAMRSLVIFTATQQDAIQVAKSKGEDVTELEAMNDLLLPIVKGVGSERSYALLAESLQTLGGSGFLQEYPIEQYIRDAKIDTLYEGTTAIQAQDFFFRKIVKNGGQAIGKLSAEIKAFAESEAGNGRLKEERALLLKALGDVEKMVEIMVGHAMGSAEDSRELYKVGLNSVRLLFAFGDVVLAWLLLRQAEVALNSIDGADEDDKNFYTGKIAAATFFAEQFLPRVTAELKIAQNVNLGVMEVPEEAF